MERSLSPAEYAMSLALADVAGVGVSLAFADAIDDADGADDAVGAVPGQPFPGMAMSDA